MVLLDLFIAGSQTTSNTLDFAFLLMLKNQSIQEKVYLEICQNVGNENLPNIADKSR